MSYHFDNNNRYQIIYPYTSDRIYVESDLSTGVYKCYQEIKNKGVKTYIFIVHDIDSGKLYYFNIPKYKDIDKGMPVQTIKPENQAVNPMVPELILGLQSINHNPSIKDIADGNSDTDHEAGNGVGMKNPDNCKIIITQENNVADNKAMAPDFDKLKQNEIITRLNHVEYELWELKKKLASKKKKPPKEEESCVIM